VIGRLETKGYQLDVSMLNEKFKRVWPMSGIWKNSLFEVRCEDIAKCRSPTRLLAFRLALKGELHSC